MLRNPSVFPLPTTDRPLNQTTNTMNGSTKRQASDLSLNPMVRATEGWLELFLSPPEKQNFANWKEMRTDKSILHSMLQPLFERLARRLPSNLAPNVITLTGFLSLGQAWYLVNEYGSEYPSACTLLAFVNVLLFFVTNELTGYHALHIRQNTALNDLFKYCCDTGSTVWIILLLVFLLGGHSIQTQWYAVQAAQLVLLLKHLSAFRRHAGVRYHKITGGPAEVLLSVLVLLAIRGIFGLETLQDGYRQIVNDQMGYERITGDLLIRTLYYALFGASILQALRLSKPWNRFGLIVSLLMRLVPALLLQSSVEYQVTTGDAVCDGLFLAVLTSDLILAKMAGRQLHPWVIVMSLAAVLSHGIILILVGVYYIGVFSDLCFYLNLPLFASCRNVYCDGVYDLCHIGHKRAFQNALALGNRLLVGVMGDEDCANYKRPPIMTHDERCAEVEACKAVTKVIRNAPCFGLTQDFLDEHNIHVVAMGEEYFAKYPDEKDDPYYSLPRQLGIAVPVPRTNELSTTDLIKRIQTANVNKISPT